MLKYEQYTFRIKYFSCKCKYKRKIYPQKLHICMYIIMCAYGIFYVHTYAYTL